MPKGVFKSKTKGASGMKMTKTLSAMPKNKTPNVSKAVGKFGAKAK